MKKQRGSKAMLVASIFSYVSVAFSVFCFIMFAFNIGNICGFYEALYKKYISPDIDIESHITFMSIEYLIIALIDVFFANFYLKGYRFRINPKNYGSRVVISAVWQMLLGSFFPGLVALICGIVVSKSKEHVPNIPAETKSEFMSNYKLEAMTEAVRRLKELKDKGAISEEEYFATLNKILES